jgi:hypothetical protein
LLSLGVVELVELEVEAVAVEVLVVFYRPQAMLLLLVPQLQ